MLLLTGVLCAVFVRRLWIIYCFIVKILIGCCVLFLILWDLVGLLKNGNWPSFWLVELVGEAQFRRLEFSFVVFDMVYMGVVKVRTLRRISGNTQRIEFKMRNSTLDRGCPCDEKMRKNHLRWFSDVGKRAINALVRRSEWI